MYCIHHICFISFPKNPNKVTMKAINSNTLISFSTNCLVLVIPDETLKSPLNQHPEPSELCRSEAWPPKRLKAPRHLRPADLSNNGETTGGYTKAQEKHGQ